MEVNARVNYPIKYALRDMEQRGVVDMELECTKFYVSSVSLRVASVVMKRTVNTWNHHPIPGMSYTLHKVQHIGPKVYPPSSPYL